MPGPARPPGRRSWPPVSRSSPGDGSCPRSHRRASMAGGWDRSTLPRPGSPTSSPRRCRGSATRSGSPREDPSASAHRSPPWLVEAEGGLDGGASVALRVELGAHEPDEQRAGDDSDVAHPVGRAVVQLSSRADPSLVVDAADFFGAPAAVISRFGDGAETELLLALRRGVRAWARLEPLLRGRIPIGLDLDEDALEDLLGEAAPALSSAGIDVLWPADLVTDGLALRAEVVGAPQPMTAGGFDLGSLLEFRWQLTLGGELLDEDEIAQLAEAKRGLVRLRGRFVAADPALL